MEIRVDTTKMGRLTDALIHLKKSAFPSVTKNTLNDLVFETKKNVPTFAKKNFTVRDKNLFTKGIGFEKAKTDRIEKMQAKVGLRSDFKVMKEIVKQELGGKSDNSSFIPLNSARISKSYGRKITKRAKLSNVPLKKGSKYFILKSKKGSDLLVEKRGKKNKLQPLYTFKKGRKVQIKKRPFLYPSAEKAQLKTMYFFKKNAQYVVQKDLKRKYGI